MKKNALLAKSSATPLKTLGAIEAIEAIAVTDAFDAANPSRRESLVRLTLAAAAFMVALPPKKADANSLTDALAKALPPGGSGGGLGSISNTDASAGVKAALQKGAEVAVSLLGKQDGFMGNDKVRIPLPQWIEKAQSALKLLGRGKDVDELKLGINRAAEQAVPEAKALLVNAVKGMTVQDAKGILQGGDNAVTSFFKSKTETPLGEKFLPIVTKVTERIGLAMQYNQLAGQGEKLGLIKGDQARVERHVTNKALDGLYFMIGEEEKKIRQDPIGTGSDILKKVFGALR